MRIIICAVIALFALVVGAIEASAQGSMAFYNNRSDKQTAAVDAKGVRHRGDSYGQKAPPWLNDKVKAVAPEYPYADRARRNEGTGIFRLSLDLKTGAVVKITTLKSTGFRSLDDAAVTSLRHWSWKPGKWKEIDMPVTFQMSSGPARLPPGATRIP